MEYFVPDETDWRIIDILKEGIQTNSRIAEMLDVSEGMVRSRLKKLKDNGVLTIRAQINPDLLENKQLAYIAVKVEQTHLLEKKADELSSLDEVLSVSLTSGRYDLLAEVLVDSNRGLVRFLTGSLAGIEGIKATETFLALKNSNKYV